MPTSNYNAVFAVCLSNCNAGFAVCSSNYNAGVAVCSSNYNAGFAVCSSNYNAGFALFFIPEDWCLRVTIMLVFPFIRLTIMLVLPFVPEDWCLRPAELQHDREVRLAVGADGKREQLVAGTGGVRGSVPEPPAQRVRAPPGSRLRRRHGGSLSHLYSLHHCKYWLSLPGLGVGEGRGGLGGGPRVVRVHWRWL